MSCANQLKLGNSSSAHRREADGAIQSLERHLQGVGQLSARNASKLKLSTGDACPASLEAAGEVLGLLHDLGKYSNAFQNYLASAVEFRQLPQNGG